MFSGGIDGTRIVDDVMARQVRLHDEETDAYDDGGHSAQDVPDNAEAPAVGHCFVRHSRFGHWIHSHYSEAYSDLAKIGPMDVFRFVDMHFGAYLKSFRTWLRG